MLGSVNVDERKNAAGGTGLAEADRATIGLLAAEPGRVANDANEVIVVDLR